MVVPKSTLDREVLRHLRADPTRWLMKGRSPLLRWRVAVELLGWPREDDDVKRWWVRRYEDTELRSIIKAQWPDGLWYEDHPFYRRRETLYAPLYRAAVWQLPLLADLGVTIAEPAVACAAAAFVRRITADGSLDLGPGGPFIYGSAIAIWTLAALGVDQDLLRPARLWLATQARWDGGFADGDEILSPDAPSVVATTAAAARALAGEPAVAAARDSARRYLVSQLFTSYAGRFPPTARWWRALSWPQPRYDALSVAQALRDAGASRREIRPLAEVVQSLQQRRGFWRQSAGLSDNYWFIPVEAGRASRWITFLATRFLIWYYRGENNCDRSGNLL